MVELTVKEICDILNISAETVRRWVRSGKLETTERGSGRKESKVNVADLCEFIKENQRKYINPLATWMKAKNIPDDVWHSDEPRPIGFSKYDPDTQREMLERRMSLYYKTSTPVYPDDNSKKDADIRHNENSLGTNLEPVPEDSLDIVHIENYPDSEPIIIEINRKKEEIKRLEAYFSRLMLTPETIKEHAEKGDLEQVKKEYDLQYDIYSMKIRQLEALSNKALMEEYLKNKPTEEN